MPQNASVILQTSGQLPALERAIAAFELQTRLDFELIVVICGSGFAVREWVRARRSPLSIDTVASEGAFGRAEMLNRAALRSRGSRLLFVCGDAVPRRRFVAAHLAGARPDRYLVSGSLRERGEQSRAPGLERGPVLRSIVSARFGLAWRRDDPLAQSFSVDRESFFRVNGYDQCFVDDAQQELNLRKRLQLLGQRPRRLRRRARVLRPACSAHALRTTRLRLVSADEPNELVPEASVGLRELAARRQA